MVDGGRNTLNSSGPGTWDDGVCLFSEDGSHLVRCIAPVEHYDVPAFCCVIDAKAFAYNATLASITLPEGLVEIGDAAFASSRLVQLAIPASVRRIGNRAFANSASLRVLDIAEGVEYIGDYAFEGMHALEHLRIPASVRHIGTGLRRVFGRRPKEAGRITVAPESEHFLTDERGVLYRKLPADAVGNHAPAAPATAGERHTHVNLVLSETLAEVVGEYRVLDGAIAIQPDAFVCNVPLTAVRLPEGLRTIGARAFRDCTNLESINLPTTLESIDDEAFCRCFPLERIELPEGLRTIGDHAFNHTSLVQVRIPASLEHLGLLAFVLDGYLPHDPADGSRASHYGIPKGYCYDTPSTTGYWTMENINSLFDAPRDMAAKMARRLDGDGTLSFSVAEGNERFSIQNDFLCERTESGITQAILYAGNDQVVTVPRNVTRICAKALGQAIDVRELHLHQGIERVGADALKLSRALDTVRVDLDTGEQLCVYPATGSMGVIAQNFGYMKGQLDLPSLVNACDSSIAHMDGGFDRLHRLVARLDNGCMLAEDNRAAFERAVAEGLDELVAGYARLDDTDGLDRLLRLNFIDASNIVNAVETANETGSAVATHFLLERKAQLGGASMLSDLSL